MKIPHDNQIATVIDDAPAEPAAGNYLAPPRIITGSSLPLSRRLPIALLCATLLFNLMYLLTVQFNSSILPVSGGLLLGQLVAIFKSQKWPPAALWLALAVVLAGFFIGF
jgi:hypothetical protein